jgi:hypothetical protein
MLLSGDLHMKTIIAFLLITLPVIGNSASDKEIAEAKKSITSLMRPLIPGSDKTLPKELGDFRVDACEKHKIKWMDVLLTKEKPRLTYSFKAGCDLQGHIEPTVFTPFPANLDLRHLEAYKRIETENKIQASFEARPLVSLAMRKGFLRGPKGVLKFEADYAVRVNPMKKGKDAVEENLGGEIRISEIYEEKVSIKEKIKIE